MVVKWIYELPQAVQNDIKKEVSEICDCIGYTEEEKAEAIDIVMREKLVNVIGDSENELSVDKYGKYIFRG